MKTKGTVFNKELADWNYSDLWFIALCFFCTLDVYLFMGGMSWIFIATLMKIPWMHEYLTKN